MDVTDVVVGVWMGFLFLAGIVATVVLGAAFGIFLASATTFVGAFRYWLESVENECRHRLIRSTEQKP